MPIFKHTYAMLSTSRLTIFLLLLCASANRLILTNRAGAKIWLVQTTISWGRKVKTPNKLLQYQLYSSKFCLIRLNKLQFIKVFTTIVTFALISG